MDLAARTCVRMPPKLAGGRASVVNQSSMRPGRLSVRWQLVANERPDRVTKNRFFDIAVVLVVED